MAEDDETTVGEGAGGAVRIGLRVVVGRKTLRMEDLLRLGGGSVVALDARVGDPVTISAGTRRVASGELTVGKDGRIGVVLTEIAGRR